MSHSTEPSVSATDGSQMTARRRRLEADLMMLQSDRDKLMRQQELIEVDRRSLLKAMETDQLRLEELQHQSEKLERNIEIMDVELSRLKKLMSRL